MGASNLLRPLVLGVDLGTTFSASAVSDDGVVSVINLRERGSTISSTVFVREDGMLLYGEPAEARGVLQPDRIAREFKRRLGDNAPLVLGGMPFSAAELTESLLREILRMSAERLGQNPSTVVITHPASFGELRLDLLRDIARNAGAPDVRLLPEPLAAAIEYASKHRVQIGDTIATYDLGGGTFDTAVVKKTGDGFELLGQPAGIERLGGVDFDEALLSLVNDRLGGALEELDETDETVRQALAELKSRVRRAKELLSSDNDAVVVVGLLGVAPSIHIARRDLNAIVRPQLQRTFELLSSTVASAGLTIEQVSTVMLVGGSTRMPIVRSTISDMCGRPAAVDIDPDFGVALGAARSVFIAGGDRHTASGSFAGLPPQTSHAQTSRTNPQPPAASSSLTEASGVVTSQVEPKRRRKIGRIALIGAGVLGGVAIAIAIATLGGSDSNPSATTIVQDTAAATEPQGPTSTQSGIVVEPAATEVLPTTTTTTTVSSSQAPAVAGVESLTLEGFSTVRGAASGQLFVQRVGGQGSSIDLGGDVLEASVAPDGRRIAVVRRIAGHRVLGLATMNKGKAVVADVGFSGEASDPAWRPDGSGFAFTGTPVGSSSDIFFYDIAAGSSSTLVQSNSTERFPAWSPNGKQLSFVSDRNGFAQLLFVFDTTTGSTRSAGLDTGASSSTWIDDQTLAVQTDFGGTPDLALVALDSGAPQRLTTTPSEERNPQALPGQHGLLATVGDPSGPFVELISTDDRSTRNITDPGTGDHGATPLTAQQIAGLSV